MAVLTTSEGLLTDKEAKKRNVGGEILCTIA
jgi:ribosomal protein S8